MNHETMTRIDALTKEIEEHKAEHTRLISSLLETRAELYTSINDYQNAVDDYIKAAELKDDGSVFYVEDDDYGWCMTSAFCIALLQKHICFLDHIYYCALWDDKTDLNEIKEYLAKTYTAQEDWDAIFSKTEKAIRYIPEQFLTESICLEALNRDDKFNTDWDSLLKYIPKDKITKEMSEIAANHSAYALEYMPDTLKTSELCLQSVKRKGHVLEYVPEALRTAEICLAAVQDNGHALQYVPTPLRTKELCEAALHGKSQGSRLAFADIPDQLKTPEMCLEAVTKWGYGLAHVPRAYRTAEICLAAVKNQSGALEYVPKDLITLEMCVIASKDRAFCIEYVPEHLVNEVKDICGIKPRERKQQTATDTEAVKRAAEAAEWVDYIPFD